MAKIILFFFFSIIVFLPFADIEVSVNFGKELSLFFSGLLSLEVDSYKDIFFGIINTIAVGIVGLGLALFLGLFLCFLMPYRLVRVILTYFRAIHELFWILLLIPVFGLTPLCGVMGLAIPYSAMCAKVINDLLGEIKASQNRAFPNYSMSLLFYVSLPKIFPSLKEFIRFRLECALRATTLMGFIGLPTLGFYLETAFDESLYGQLWVLLGVFLIISHGTKFYVRKNVFIVLGLLSIVFVCSDLFFSWENLLRSLKTALVPWPIKQHFLGADNFSSLAKVFSWFSVFFKEKIFNGIWNTIVLSQISVGICFFLSLFIIPFTSRWFVSKTSGNIIKTNLFLFRNIPEYIMATLLLFFFGPSMVPAILALAIHNAGIISHLSVLEIDKMDFSAISVKRKFDQFLYIVLPKSISKIAIYSCFRWEFFIREASILGFLGIKTLGFYADSAYNMNKYDDLVIILFVMANLNLLVTKVGQKIQGMQLAE
jgi:phosphonate transport system permease protein